MRALFSACRWLVAILGALTCGFLCGVSGYLDRSHRLALFLNRLFARLFLPLTGIRLRVSGEAATNFKQNYVVCSNHQGLFDIFTLMAALPLPLRFVSKPSYFRIPFIGWGMRGSGHIEITRTDKEKDRETLDRLVELVKGGATIVMFPEGTRTRDGKVLPFKSGAFYVAHHSGIPILPVSIQGSFERMQKGRLLPDPGEIRVTLHPLISPTGLSIEELKEETRVKILTSFLSN